MNISDAASRSGLSAKTIRYYEQIQLIAPAQRDSNSYRIYSDSSLSELRFVRRARDVGFSVDECRALLSIYRDPQRHSAHVRGLVLEKCTQIDNRIDELRTMREMLLGLASQCNGDEGPECAILEELGRLEVAQ
jgi:MerR family copper efflux transcriptional regulator